MDAAYGGYFCSTFRDGDSLLPKQAVRAFSALPRVDSVTLDPHKLGFVPYACGAFLVREPRGYSVSNISAPYLKEDEKTDQPSWSTTLEGSRSATGAGAVWLSSRVLPLDARGHGGILNQTLAARNLLAQKLEAAFDDIHFMPGSDTNIVSFVLARPGTALSKVNDTTGFIIDSFGDSPNFAISRTSLSAGSYQALVSSVLSQWQGELDDDHLLVVRLVVMNPYLGHVETTEKLLAEFIDELQGFYRSAP